MGKLDIELDRWLPDLLPFAMPKGGLTVCKNIWPLEEGFKIVPSLVDYSSNAISGTNLSGIEFYADDGTYYVFLGTTTGLYRLETNKSLTNVTRVSGAYTTTTNKWDFCKYGNWVIATNYDDEVQVLKGMGAANFEPLVTTETIKAKYCVQNHGFLFLGYYTRGGVTYPNGVIWSAKDLITDFTKSVSTMADSVNLAECPGPITSMKVFEFASAGYESNIAIFHPNSISVAWFSGGEYTYSFDHNRYLGMGALAGTPIIVDGICFFFDEETFYRWDGINAPEDIGFGVRRNIIDFLDIANYYKIVAAQHPRNGLVVWSFVSTAGGGNPDYVLVLNVRTKKFALIEQAQYGVFSMHRQPWTIDQLGDFFPSIDEIPYPMDSNYWSENSNVFACLGTNGKIQLFQGNAMNWEIETGEVYTPKREVIRARRTRPIMQKRTQAATVKIGTRMQESDDVAYSTAAVGSNGFADIRAFGRYMRVNLSGGIHDGLFGIDLEGDIIGRK